MDRDRHYPWRVLVCCALLNRTSGRHQVWPMLDELFRRCRAPADMLTADLADLLRPLGLQNRRAATLRQLTQDYVDGQPVASIHGVGQYALDAWDLFVCGRTDVQPADHWLIPYLAWRIEDEHHTSPEWGDEFDRAAATGRSEL